MAGISGPFEQAANLSISLAVNSKKGVRHCTFRSSRQREDFSISTALSSSGAD